VHRKRRMRKATSRSPAARRSRGSPVAPRARRGRGGLQHQPHGLPGNPHDPSYAGQLVTFTVAELGNYGIHHGDEQATRRRCRDSSRGASPASPPTGAPTSPCRPGSGGRAWPASRDSTRGAWCVSCAAPARSRGSSIPRAPRRRRSSIARGGCPGWKGRTWRARSPARSPTTGRRGSPGRSPQQPRHDVVVVDYGVKRGILRQLVDAGCPCAGGAVAHASRRDLAQKPQGVVLSNGQVTRRRGGRRSAGRRAAGQVPGWESARPPGRWRAPRPAASARGSRRLACATAPPAHGSPRPPAGADAALHSVVDHHHVVPGCCGLRPATPCAQS